MALDNLTIFQTSKIFFSKCLLKLRMRYPLSHAGSFKIREKVDSVLDRGENLEFSF